MLNVKYGLQYSAFISSAFVHVLCKLTDTDEMEQYHWKPWGAVKPIGHARHDASFSHWKILVKGILRPHVTDRTSFQSRLESAVCRGAKNAMK